MRGGSRRSRFASASLVVAGSLIMATAWGAPGMVVSNSKISDTQGNFTAVIDDLDELGGATAWLGDLDGAGPSVAAMAIGAIGDDDGSGNRGAVYIAFLNAAGSVLSHVKISDLTNLPGQPLDGLDEFGSSMAYLGDLDGMGPSAAALAVGAPFDDDGGTDRGAVYILFLNQAGTVTSVQKISALQGNLTGPIDNFDEFGGAVANLGDLDNGGPTALTLAVGAGGDDDGGGDRGAVYILFLDASGVVKAQQKISSTQGNFAGPLDNADDFGAAVADLDDLDGPTGPSAVALAVSAPLDDDGGADRGAVYVLFLSPAGTVMSQQKISDLQGNFSDFFSDFDEFGGSLAHLYDIDGPGTGGVTALAVGVAGDDDGGEDRGALHVLFLNANGTCAGSQKISDFFGNFPVALENLDGFGTSLSFLGDLNGAGAGVVTIAVGATGDDDGGALATSDRGAVYLLTLDGTSLVGVSPPAPSAARALLGRASPNPFHPVTTIPFRLAESADVRLEVWDVTGRRVRRLVQARVPAGDHHADWDGRDDSGDGLPTGTYFIRLMVDGRPAGGLGKAMLLR
jgi:hypothetical protein